MADEIKTALQQFRARAEQYRLCRQYYDGQHRLAFATEKFRNAFGTLFRTLADNLCPAVCDPLVDRLKLTGFSVEEGSASTSDDAWVIWSANRMDKRARQVHLEAVRCGDAYVIAWPGQDGQPTLHPNAGSVITVHYDPEQPGHIEWAAKQWLQDDGRLRLNMYYADRIEKWVTSGKADAIPEGESAFIEYQAQGEPWPLPNPWERVPVFHFANNADVGEMGASELQNVIPLQDALNKAIADMLVAMEYVALPQRWATGLEVEIDEVTGKPRQPFTPGVERVWAVGDPATRFGQFDPANLEQFLRVQDSFRAEVARVSGTPFHYLMLQTGDFPSGEAMKTAEERFLAKVEDCQVSFGNVWEDIMALALRMAGKAEARLSAEWQDPTPRNEKEQGELGLIKQQLGVSRQQILTELGYSPADIERMEEEKEVSSAALGEAVLGAFERGE